MFGTQVLEKFEITMNIVQDNNDFILTPFQMILGMGSQTIGITYYENNTQKTYEIGTEFVNSGS